jgi:Chlorophyll A-B binding protein
MLASVSAFVQQYLHSTIYPNFISVVRATVTCIIACSITASSALQQCAATPNSTLRCALFASRTITDPLNLAKDEKTLLFYRDAEQKHGRLAMLASLGWVVAELFDGRLASAVNEPDLLVRPDGEGIGLAPSLLNGGLATVPLAYWLIVVGLTGALETQFTQATPGIVAQGKEPGEQLKM